MSIIKLIWKNKRPDFVEFVLHEEAITLVLCRRAAVENLFFLSAIPLSKLALNCLTLLVSASTSLQRKLEGGTIAYKFKSP